MAFLNAVLTLIGLLACSAFRLKAFRMRTDSLVHVASQNGVVAARRSQGRKMGRTRQWYDCQRKHVLGHSGEWLTLQEAGWTSGDIKKAQDDSVEEGDDPVFQQELLKQVSATGIKCCASYNDKLLEFVHPDDPHEMFADSLNNSGKVVVFVLGPSGAGKTSSVATVMQRFLRFPVITYDGGDWRKVSQVWKCHAQDPDGPRLTDYFDTVNAGSKSKFESLLETWISTYNPNTILVPETAVPCVSTFGKLRAKMCPLLKKIKFFRKLGYNNVRFVVVHANFATVYASAHARAWKEGKVYNPCTYGLAMASVFNLYHKYKDSDPHNVQYSWEFVENTFAKNEAPKEMDWETYKEKARNAFEVFQELTESWGSGCKRRYKWLANHTISNPKD